MLKDIRVLEISAPETMLAGRILADLGADVVTVEPPGGSAGRRLDPFIDGIPGIERSLAWHALNRNKRGITLELTSPDGQELFAALAEKFDVVFEVTGPRGIAPLDNAVLPPKMIRCSISAFGRSGPKSEYAASDLIVMAATGAPGMTGDSDRPPIFFPVPQSMMEAGAEAAIAALAAVAARDRDGLGQKAEVSARIAGMMAAFLVPLTIGSGNRPLSRASSETSVAGVKIPAAFQCADGYANIPFAFGSAFGPMTQRLAKWAADEGFVSQKIAEVNWSTFPGDVSQGKAKPGDLEALVGGVRLLFLGKTKAQIDEMSRRLALLSSSMMSMDDIAQFTQYRERGLWNTVTVGPAGKQIEVPARFAQFSNYSIETARPAPALSEHTFKILTSEGGLSPTEIQSLFVHGIV